MSSSFEGIYQPGIVDPGLPIAKPTTSFWHSQLHPLADYQSPWPSKPVDVAIIGSGMTGTSLAHTLLLRQPGSRIVILDARSLCSGATGRNGGHIKTMSYADWDDRKKAYGVEEAARLTAFEHSHLQTIKSVVLQYGIDCSFEETEGVDAYYDQKTFARAVTALKNMRADIPQLADQYQIVTDIQRLQQDMKLSDRCIGAITIRSASVWPYKIVMSILQRLVESHGLNVQPHTAVISISDTSEKELAVLRTGRGEIRAKHIVHATNGWIGHLVPELRPFISPVRGNVVHYSSIRNKSPMGFDSRYSFWMRYAARDYDYLIQRAPGDIVVGRANMNRTATGDDSQTDISPIAHLRGMASEVAVSPNPGAGAYVTHAWSGILGFTQDTTPFVGRLPFPYRYNQWVCGGYHGVGMTKAFRAGQTAALLILGESLPDDFPRSMLVSEKRMDMLRKSLSGDSVLDKTRL